MANASSILAALDGPYLSDPESGPSVPAGTLRPLEPQGDLLDPSYNLLKRKLDQIPQLTQAMRFAPTMRTPSQSQGNKRPRYSDAPSANPISLMLGGDEGSSPIRGSPSQRSRGTPQRPGMRGSQGSNETPARPPAGSTMFEFALHYDKDGPTALDRGGEDQEKQMQEFVNRNLNDLNHGRSIEDSLKVLNLSSKKDVVPGMNIRLMNHQIVGVAWMVDQETKTPHKGGILADDMGLGKTVQMIATMAINTPTDKSNGKTTLIVVPAALIQQWKDELETKANGMFDVHIHHGPSKLKTLKAAKEKDVIITTYHTLWAECKTPEDVDEAELLNYVHQSGGILPRMNWHRVVLDEAQFIRNRKARSSRAVTYLRSTYRWCLTGTPVTNTLVDVYAMLRFGRFRPWNDWDDFHSHVASIMATDTPTAGMRTQEILRPLMIRRLKTTKQADGTPLVVLPAKEIELVELEFSKEEREIYDSYEKSARIKINKFIKKGTLLKNSSYILVMILRLRQLSCHPFLIISLGGDIGEGALVAGDDADKELHRCKQIMPGAWIKKVKARFLLRKQALEMDFPDDTEIPDDMCPVCFDAMTDESGRVLECGHEMCFDCLLDLRKSAFGTTTEVQHDEKDEIGIEAAAAKGYRPCPTCKKMIDITEHKTFRHYAFEPDEDEVEAAVQASKKAQCNKRGGSGGQKGKNGFKSRFKGRDHDGDQIMELDSDDEVEVKPEPNWQEKAKKALAEESDDDDLPDLMTLLAAPKPKVKDEKKPKAEKREEEEEEEEEDEDAQTKRDKEGPKDKTFYNQSITTFSKDGQNMEPSTKMAHTLELLSEWEASGDKVIVYSQWTSMLDLLDTLFMRQGIRSLRYDGRMNREQRDRVLREFKQPGGPKIICISIKCGGVGLNLVAANRVINLDLSWNFATESQAYDRVHRVGQEKEVAIKRLVVKNTLEERMLRLQDLKTDLSDAALGEGSGTKLHKLSVKEIKRLFGFDNINKAPDPNQTTLH